MPEQKEILLQEEELLLPEDSNIYTLITIFYEVDEFIELLEFFVQCKVF